MTRPANDPVTFVLFEPLSAVAGRTSEEGFQLKVMPGKESNPVPPAPPPRPPGSAASSAFAHTHPADRPAALAQPIVTLQREGDKVTGIRIACICGQVIELVCAY